MPPHPEVPATLRRLRDSGLRLFTLTENLLEVQTRQLEYGGIVDLFERRFSADGVKEHKPSRQAYAYVERELGVEPSRLCLVACHTWDTLGAVAAGWEAALIKRAGNDVLGSALSRTSSATTSMTSPVSSSPGTGNGTERRHPPTPDVPLEAGASNVT